MPLIDQNDPRQPLVSVFIPTLNNAENIKELLDSLSSQKTDFFYEITIIDSGSYDGTVDIIKNQYPKVRLHQIPNSEFSHGGTRNLGIKISKGKYIAMLSQDATPATENWLQSFVDCFKLDPMIAGAYGLQIPRPYANPTLKRDIINHFNWISTSSEPVVFQIPQGADGLRQYEKDPHRIRFFSDVNSCLRRDVWEKIPYRHIPYAEDQMWSDDILRAGYKKVYTPKAAVLHTNMFPLRKAFFRYFDEYRALRRLFKDVHIRSIPHIFIIIYKSLVVDTKFVWKQNDYNFFQKIYWTGHVLGMNCCRWTGAYFGGRYERLPHWFQWCLSLEEKMRSKAKRIARKRQESKLLKAPKGSLKYMLGKTWITFQAQGFFATLRIIKEFVVMKLKKKYGGVHHVEGAGVATLQATTQPEPVKYEPYFYEFVNLVDETKKVHQSYTLPHNKNNDGTLTINWVLLDFGKVSGGTNTILRIVNYLEKQGHKVRIYIQHFSTVFHSTADTLKKEITDHYGYPLKAEIVMGTDAMVDADAIIATAWPTAYSVASTKAHGKKYYLVQDFEPAFYPHSAEYIFAENTYKLGLHGIVGGPWLAKVAKNYGMNVDYYQLGYDKENYFLDEKTERDPKTIMFQARWVTPRRAFELGVLALELVHKKHPDAKIIFYGWGNTQDKGIPFPYEEYGIIDDPKKVAELYNRATVGVAFSLTNPSLVAIEMMACGLPVVELNTDATREVYKHEETAYLADMNPHAIAAGINYFLDHPQKRHSVSQHALKYAQSLDWHDALELVENVLLRDAGVKGYNPPVAKAHPKKEHT